MVEVLEVHHCNQAIQDLPAAAGVARLLVISAVLLRLQVVPAGTD
jgi:hypothetical protein